MRAPHDLELHLVGAVDADLGRVDHHRQRVDELGQRARPSRQQLEQARAGVDRVVEAEASGGRRTCARDISPASARRLSFIFALISEWPTFHIMACPPARAISSYSACEHFTSPTNVAPGCSRGWRARTGSSAGRPTRCGPWRRPRRCGRRRRRARCPPRRRSRVTVAIRSATFSGSSDRGGGWGSGRRARSRAASTSKPSAR